MAVVVAHDPGDWFEECLSSLGDQDYPNLAVLVVDAASEAPVEERVHAVLPDAHVRRLDASSGYGAAANEVLDVVDGAAFHLHCHDDVALDPDVVRVLVEEAYRSNAGVVGPKLTRWYEPRRITQIGESIDKAGYAVPLVERGELDQEQHDSVRDVFTVPGGCTLIRADLFSEVGGFDEGIELLADDLSLCWRVHLAGARVMVAPDARVRHVEALSGRRPAPERRRMLNRHRLRVVLTSYSPLSLLRVVPQIVVLHVAEALYSLVVGRTSRAREVVDAWWWNLRRPGELRVARRQVRSIRHVRDGEVRRLQARGSARVGEFLRGHVTPEARAAPAAVPGPDTGPSAAARWSLGVWAAIAVVLVVGSRHLLTRGVPAVGEMAPFSDGPAILLREWASGWSRAGLGSDSPAPTAYALLGVGGFLAAGAMGVLRLVLTLGLLPLGAFTAYRLAAPLGSTRAQLVTLVVYVANPLPYNALSQGRWSALAVYAAAPVLVGRLARAAGLAPFGSTGGVPGPSVRPGPLHRDVLAVGLVTALVGALLPAALVVTVALALALVLGSLLVFSTAGDGRLLVAGLGGAAVAAVLHVPWTFDFVGPDATLAGFLGVERTTGTFGLDALLRFDTGALGAGPLGYALLAAAALPLLIARGWRHGWAVRGWTVALVCWGLAWAGEEGWLGVGTPAPDVLLAPAALGLALAAGLGAAAFEIDLPGYRFGWRQLASGIAAMAVVVGAAPVLGGALDGQWSMPAGDHARALRSLDAAIDAEPARVLWLGAPDVVPLRGWELDPGLEYATTSGGAPEVQDLWSGSDAGSTGLIAEALDLARAGDTARLGRLLAPMAVRYVVVVERLAPAPWTTQDVAIPEGLAATLEAQLDLRHLDVPAGLQVYENEAYVSALALAPDGAAAEATSLTDALALDVSGAVPVLPDETGAFRWEGDLRPGYLLASQGASGRWRLEVAGEAAERDETFGWANGFAVESPGPAVLSYRTPVLRYVLLGIQVLLWLAVGRHLLKGRFGPPPAGHRGAGR
ncbi:MAG: glycosyltransferase [Acidimicrobiia bacterium]